MRGFQQVANEGRQYWGARFRHDGPRDCGQTKPVCTMRSVGQMRRNGLREARARV